VWRGQLGYYLHRLADEESHAQDLSLYQRLFRTPRSAVGVPDYSGRVLGPIGLAGEHVPHPFVVRQAIPEAPATDLRLAPGDETAVELMLMGPAVRHLPQLTALFETMGADGIGRRVEQPGGETARGAVALTGAALRIEGVSLTLYDGAEWRLPPTCGPELYDRAAALAPEHDTNKDPAQADTQRLTLRTPTRLRFGGDRVGPEALDADALAAALYRRVVGMAVCYGPATPGAEQIAAWQDGFKALAAPTSLHTTDVRRVEDRRYSHRQERPVPAGGLAGPLRLEAPPGVLRTWRNWLRRAERLHLGAGTSMGLGRVGLD
jgi:hypothetical protein